MPTFVISHAGYNLKVIPGVGVVWVSKDSNTYPSKYAAKRHLKQLDNVPNNVKIVELETVMEKL